VSKNPEFYADFGSEEIIQKKRTEKRSDPKILTDFFQEKLFFGIIFFPVYFF
jgi:hypothetical protein